MYQLKKNIYNKKQKMPNKRLYDDKKTVKTRVNLAKKDRKKINQF